MRLTSFWERLETNFPLGGPRRHLQDFLGLDLAAALEGAGILKQRRVAETFPCPRPGGDNCPRIIVRIAHGIGHAVCGNSPAECPDVMLSPRDMAFLTVDPASLCRTIALVLRIHPKIEAIAGIADAYRVGTFIPDPGIKHSVLFLVRTSAVGYAEALEALRSRQEGDPFAVLAPTERFLGDDTIGRMRTVGVTILALTDVIGIEDGQLVALADPIRLFSGLGQRVTAASNLSAEIVARALVADGAAPPQWRNLDEQEYRALVASADRYDVFADEQTKTISKGTSRDRRRDTATASHFRVIRSVVTKRGYFDPVDDDADDRLSAQQIFQRARKLFDPRNGKGSWKLFKTIKDGGRAVYHFQPDPGVSFAFVFLPEA